MEPTSIDGLVAHCQSGRFTGILRLRAREGIGEIWFLSGIADEVHFGVSKANDALDRMRKAADATYELVARLPHPAGGFKSRFPSKGSIATATPVTLMRYCERYALTCTLAVESGDVLVEARYELGELVSVETTADDDGITAMLEAKEGKYEFTLPRVELPAGTPVLPPAPSLLESMPPPESLGFRALLQTKPAVGRPASDEAEVKRKTIAVAHQQKSATTATTRSVPRPAETAKPVAKEKEAKPAAAQAAPSKTEPTKTPTPTVDAKKEEAKPAAAQAAPSETEPTKTPPTVDAKKEEAKPAAAQAAPSETEPAKTPTPTVDAEKGEAQPAAATRVVEDTRDDERVPAPQNDEPAAPESEPAKMPPPTAPLAKRSLTWLVVPLLVAVAVVYLLWTHRM